MHVAKLGIENQELRIGGGNSKFQIHDSQFRNALLWWPALVPTEKAVPVVAVDVPC
jgi:hypothetical protein